MKRLKLLNQAGDTIIEVMITTTVLALVLTVSFVSANHSLSAGTQAANRRQALQYAEEQVERIRVAANAPDAAQAGSNYSKYILNSQAFCIDSDGTKIAATLANHVCLPLSDQGNFRDGIIYSSANQTFTVTVKWEHANDNGGFATANNNLLDQVVLYYKAQ